jgi:hypothetical protein
LKEWNNAFESTNDVHNRCGNIELVAAKVIESIELLNRAPEQITHADFVTFAERLVSVKAHEEMRLRFIVGRFMSFVNTFPEIDSDGICGNMAIACGNHRAFQFQDLVHKLIYQPRGRLFHNDFVHVQAALISLLCAMCRVDLLASCAKSLLQDTMGLTTAFDSATLKQCVEQLSNRRALHYACNQNVAATPAKKYVDRSGPGCVCHQRVCECRPTLQPSVADVHLLAFEHANGIMIRRDQLKMVDEILLQYRKNQPAIVHQAIMGCGKTSVICPLLALKLSDSKPSRLVVVVCPPNLLLQTSKQLREKLCLVFKKRVVTFSFDRYFVELDLCCFFVSPEQVFLQARS